ncbi:hypothetical protein MNBD_GAMMA21-814 [hydrothermal vent metagenome]|uniref:Outer membrane protein beta-barrel domain-containing protein n=1 Tax=hydrothermal vent metagenome TaxID=652676 RepID=A0A3B1ASQ5_9ZZZZ
MRFLIVIALLFGVHAGATAGELHVVVNGKAIHLDDGNYNEDNWGLGLEYNFTTKTDWITFVNASWFKDSNYNTSKYIGGGMKRRFRLDNSEDGWFFDAGAIAFLMTRKDFKNNDPFPGILPFVAVGNGPVTMNLTYIPSVSPKYKALLYFQLLVRVKTFE